MKTNLPQESQDHSERIKEIVDAIVTCGKDQISFVILFGSFARGDWIFDRYSEDGILYEYASDYDLLIITRTVKQARESPLGSLDREIKKEFEERNLIKKYQSHNPHCIFEPIKRVNDDLRRSQYFFSDIKKEGIVLYNSGEFELSVPEEMNDEKRRGLAKVDYEYWMEKSEEFLIDFNNAFQRQSYVKAAFELHQATEGLYNGALLALTGYKPKSHDLEELNKLCSTHSNHFLTIFPIADEARKECFSLLKKAYIEAIYNKDYQITKEQLEYLISRVEKLKELIKDVCKDNI
jgi:HEPN domain-containing protein